uniref:SWIM zinc finger family protein n=1 Tax=Thermorudis peleae TaxID=1382356 RepID=A0A831TDC0_9BACT
MAMTAKQAKAVAERYQKALELVEQGRVFRLYGGGEGDYVVVNGDGVAYLVNVISGECACPDAQYRCSKLGILCKHALAALIVHERAEKGAGEPPQPPAPEPEPARLSRIEVDLMEEEQARRLLEHLF